uniref:Odorant receptor n=1 Tax=Aphidius gifuensis TaxID=684658 RepID=A0A3S9LWB3_APHGI|nr:odorant receptor [Aphidius gifuensis]
MSGAKQLVQINRCKKRIQTLMLAMGLWPVKNPTIIYRIRPYIVGCSIFLVFLGLCNFIYHNSHILTIALRGVGLALSLTAVMIKIGSYIYYRKLYLEIEDILNEIMAEQLTKENIIKIMLDPIVYFSTKVSWFIFFSGYGIMSVLFSKPIIFMFKELINNVQPFKYMLHYPLVYPYKINNDLTWIAHFIFESFVSIFFCTVGTSTDNTFGYYSSHIMAQFRTLNYEIENINNNEKVAFDEKIKSLIVRHKQLIHCCILLQNANGPIVLILSLTTAVILCTLLFQISQMKNILFGQLIWLTVYISFKLFQTLIYAWSGEKITSESEQFRVSVYACNWEKMDYHSSAKSLIIMMNQRPVNLKACGILPINATLFTSMLNGSLSYFFLLRSLQES